MAADDDEWQTVQIPLASGLALKGDQRAQNPPAMDALKDAEFDDIGGLRTRKPYAALGTNIVGGGTVTNFRQIVPNGDELLLFTDTGLYSWNADLSAWAFRATHLAIHTDETDVFAATGDQASTDRASSSDVTLYAWVDQAASIIYVAAMDRDTGSVIVGPTLVAVGKHPRLVALQTRILLFFTDTAGPNLRVMAIDPSNVAISIAGGFSNVHAMNSNAFYDVMQIPGTDTAILAAALSPNTSYFVAKVTAALAITSSTKARTCDGPIAISCDPVATNVQIVRGNGVNIQGDLLLISTLADVFTAQAVGTWSGVGTLSNIGTAHRSVLNTGKYRCYVFWTNTITGAPTTAFNWVDTGGTLGSAATFLLASAIASRPFDYNGSVYLWNVFASITIASAAGFNGTQLENTNFLHRDDGTMVARCLVNRSGGFVPDGALPGVELISGKKFACGLANRRVVPTNNGGRAYASRAPCDVEFTFDDNRARRTARLGRTLYISGGQILQYDGLNLVELGFVPYPWTIDAVLSGTAGSMADGTYAYKATLSWLNAQGEIDRSTTATVAVVVISGHAGAAAIDLNISNIFTTLKLTTFSVASGTVIEIWRTAVNPTADAPFYLVTSLDPSVLTNPNRFLSNDPTTTVSATVRDGRSDAQTTILSENPENGGILENLAPPPGSILLASDVRLFLAGIAGDPDRIWYSKQRDDGVVAAFNDALVVPIPHAGGDLTGLAIYRETLFVFRETAVYALPGDGQDNTGGGPGYGTPRQLSRDVGAVNLESIAVGPFGVIFKSLKGWYVLDDKQNVQYIGAPVAAYDADTISSVQIVEKQHQVRIVTNARMLVWDYLVNQWAEWSVNDGISGTMWQDGHVYLSSNTGAMQDNGSFLGTTTGYGLDMELAWLKPADLQGAGRVRRMLLLGECRDNQHVVRVRTAYNYESDGNGSWLWRDDTILVPTQSIVGGPEQLQRGLSQQQFESVKFRITAIQDFDQASFTALSQFSIGGAIATSGTAWAATYLSNLVGDLGNSIQFSIYTCNGLGIEVRDHQKFSPVQGWVAAPYTIGIRIGTDSQTVAALETAILRYSRMVTIASHDATPAKTITNSSTLHSGFFTGGDIIQPTGESLKLTGLAVEMKPKGGLYRKLAAGQKG